MPSSHFASAALASTAQAQSGPDTFARATSFPLDAVFKALALAGLSLDALVAYLAMTREAVLERIVRLGLPTPADEPLRNPSKSGWAVHDIQLLIVWRTMGVHPEIIGQNLSRPRSANAARSKARRLGLAPPPRKSLFRPSPEQLSSLLHHCAPTHSDRSVLSRGCPGERKAPVQASLDRKHKPIPTAIEDVDFRDLTWVGSLPGRRGRPGEAVRGITTNRAAVYAIGVVACAGVDRFRAAELLGLTVGAYRSQRTRLGLPRVAVRSAFTDHFEVEVGQETIKRASLELVASIRCSDGQPPQFFWRYRDERHVRLSPSERPQRRRGEPTYSKPMTIVTRVVLNAEASIAVKPVTLSRPLPFRAPRPAQTVPPDLFDPIPAAPFTTRHASL